jgi:HK97 gp10 family phage protein
MARVVIEDHFDEYGQKVTKAMRSALVEGAEATREVAIAEAPKRTGRGAASISLSGLDESLRFQRIAVYAREFYMRFPDRGTVHIHAQHFMRRAGKLAAPRFRAAVERHLRHL